MSCLAASMSTASILTGFKTNTADELQLQMSLGVKYNDRGKIARGRNFDRKFIGFKGFGSVWQNLRKTE